MEGKLFSQDFLVHGITTTPVWEQCPETALDSFHQDLRRIYSPLAADSTLNEANTEADIIKKCSTCWAGKAGKGNSALNAKTIRNVVFVSPIKRSSVKIFGRTFLG
jgi:hypothetical protein